VLQHKVEFKREGRCTNKEDWNKFVMTTKARDRALGVRLLVVILLVREIIVVKIHRHSLRKGLEDLDSIVVIFYGSIEIYTILRFSPIVIVQSENAQELGMILKGGLACPTSELHRLLVVRLPLVTLLVGK